MWRRKKVEKRRKRESREKREGEAGGQGREKRKFEVKEEEVAEGRVDARGRLD